MAVVEELTGWTGPRTWGEVQLVCVSTQRQSKPQLHGEARTSKGKLWGGVSASLVVADETQDLAEASHGQETAVLRVCNLPYFTQNSRRKLGALEKLDGYLACDDAQLLSVGLLEEILEDALLLGGEVEYGGVCELGLALEVGHCQQYHHRHHHHQNPEMGEKKKREAAYSIPHWRRDRPWLCNLRYGGGWLEDARGRGWGDACDEAEAPSCRVARGTACVFPGDKKLGGIRGAGGGQGRLQAVSTTAATTAMGGEEEAPAAHQEEGEEWGRHGNGRLKQDKPGWTAWTAGEHAPYPPCSSLLAALARCDGCRPLAGVGQSACFTAAVIHVAQVNPVLLHAIHSAFCT